MAKKACQVFTKSITFRTFVTAFSSDSSFLRTTLSRPLSRKRWQILNITLTYECIQKYEA